MEQILANKGTGVVTSCPAGSADDYVMLTTLQKKPAYYNIEEDWVRDYHPVPIIKTPTYGDMGAVKYCKDNKIASPKDKTLLDAAKEVLYKEDFYKGTMLIGSCKDMYISLLTILILLENSHWSLGRYKKPNLSFVKN